ncbi:MAG TPA: hypothetical protein PLD37_00020 [Usitatibacteraceae bacterium]|jgi:hypothetical protein|nr:hypothetical protein [Usitatibacteraceae bacterium]
MTAKAKYTNEPIGEYRVVPDFLPPPDQLAFRDEGVKITIALSKRSVEFFKAHAAKNQTQYQRMIRQLLDAYVDAHAKQPSARSAGRNAAAATRTGRRST